MYSTDVMIIFWGNPLYDGRCMNMINQFRQKKYTVKVIGVSTEKEEFQINGAQIQLIDQNKFKYSLTKYFKYFKLIRYFIRKENPRTIVASDLYSLIPAAKIKKQKKYKLIYDSREIYTKLAALIKKPIIQKIWSSYEKKYIYEADYVIANANIDKNYLQSLYPNINIEIFKNLPGETFFKPPNLDLRKILCINNQTKILLYQGKLHRGRGIRFILKCLKQLNDAAFVIIGDGPMKNIYVKAAKKEGVTDKIFFIDSVPYEKLSAFSNSADIGVSVIQPISKSYENALPNKLFEYAVTGLPVICSNLLAMNEMIVQYKCGIAIGPKDTAAFIDAFKKIVKNKNQFKLSATIQKELLWQNQNRKLTEIIK